MANYTEKPKKKPSASRDIAMDKLDMRGGSTKPAKKQDKIKGRPKSAMARFAEAAFPQKKDSGTEKMRKIVLLVAIVVFAVTIGILLFQLVSMNNTGHIDDQIKDTAGVADETTDMHRYDDPTAGGAIPGTTASPTTGDGGELVIEPEETEEIDVTPLTNTPLNVNFSDLTAQNPDTRAWIKITGTYLNDVVMQGEAMNSKYLTTAFDGSASVSGTVYSHYRNKWDGNDQNIILFGHNMLNGERFASVRYYIPNDASREPVAFYKVHPTIMLATPDGGSQTYKIFAGIIANTDEQYGEVFKYANKTSFTDVNDFNNFIIDVMDRSWFFTDVDITYGDQLLTLSTCWWPLGEDVDTRWVLFARKVRPGESEHVDTSLATRNYNAKLFDYYYTQIGGKWYGSTWYKSKLLSYTGE